MTLEAFLGQFGSQLSGGLLLALGIALVSGIVASAVCPCTLPMGLGMAGIVGSSESECRRRGLVIAAMFFTGIVGNLTLLGVVAARLGAMLTQTFGRYWALTLAGLSFGAAGVALF